MTGKYLIRSDSKQKLQDFKIKTKPMQLHRCSAEFVMQKQLHNHLLKCDGVTKRFIRRKTNKRSASDYVKPEKSEEKNNVKEFICPIEGCAAEFVHKNAIQAHLKKAHDIPVCFRINLRKRKVAHFI